MGGEAFELCEFLNDGVGGAEGGFVEAEDAGAALELIDGESGEGFAGTSGGEGVAGAGKEVTGGDGGKSAEEDGTGTVQCCGDLAGFAAGDGDVFTGEAIGEIHGVLHGRNLDEEAVFQSEGEEFRAGE